MQRRLLSFFAAVRNETPQLRWSFLLITNDAQTWSESTLAANGMPPGWITLITADVSCPFIGKFCSGCFTTHRTIRPRKAALNVQRESQSLVADVLAEFAKLLPDYR